MKKILGSILFLFIVILGFFVVQRMSTMPKMIIPFPYVVSPYNLNNDSISNAQILIVGDRFGVKLNTYLKYLNKLITETINTRLSFYNLSKNHEGIHRSIAKIKSLKKIPPLVIYHGGSEEFYEKKFLIRDYDKILSNIKKYENDLFLSTLMLFPILSKFTYTPNTFIQLPSNKIIKHSFKYPDNFQLLRFELVYKLYELELEQFISEVKNRGSNLIFIIPPINLNSPPKKICKQSTTYQIQQEQNKVESLIKEKRYKEALIKIEKLKDPNRPNARTIYLNGQIFYEQGYFSQAKVLFEKATAYDCNDERHNYIFNVILKKIATKHNIPHINFHEIVNDFLGHNTLFVDKFFPQTIYYYKLIEKLNSKIQAQFKL